MKSLFNFYLDDGDKKQAIDKLSRICGEQSKGQLASFLRVQIKKFILTPDEKVDKNLAEAIAAEYQLSQKCNKRSRL